MQPFRYCGWLFFLLTAISVVLLAFGYFAYPVPLNDAMHFIPTAVSWSAGKGLVNPVSALAYMDPLGKSRFLFYPPLFPIVLGSLMPHATVYSALSTIAWINVVTLWLCAWMFVHALRRSGNDRFGTVLVGLALLFMSAVLCFHNGGRPEIMAMPLLALIGSFEVAAAPWNASRLLCTGLLAGLLATCHPVAAILAAVIIALSLSVAYKWPQACARLVLAGLVAAGTAAGVMVRSPYGISETLAGLRTHAKLVNHLSRALTADGLWMTYVIDTRTPFLFLFVIAAIAVSVAALWRRRQTIRWPVGAAIFALLFIVGLYKFSIGHNYNVTLVAPLLLTVIIYEAAAWPHSALYKTALAFSIGIVGLGFIRCAVLFPYYLHSGMTLPQARQRFEIYRAKQPKGTSVGLSESMWTLADRYDGMYFCVLPFTPDVHPRGEPTRIVIQQNYAPFLNPPLAEGPYRLIENNFSNWVPMPLGPLRIARKMPGYFFAIYARASDAS